MAAFRARASFSGEDVARGLLVEGAVLVELMPDSAMLPARSWGLLMSECASECETMLACQNSWFKIIVL